MRHRLVFLPGFAIATSLAKAMDKNSGFLDWESLGIDDNLLKVLVQAPLIHVIWVYDYIL